MSALAIYNNELAIKAISDLIDNSECNFTYDYIKQVGYLHFATCIEAKDFYNRMQELLATIYDLENSYNNNNNNNNNNNL